MSETAAHPPLDANTDVGAGSLDDAITKRRSIPETSIPETSMGACPKG